MRTQSSRLRKIRLTLLLLAWSALSLVPAGAGADSGRETRFHYDDLGRLVRVERAEGTVVRYTYDPAGNIENRTVERDWDFDGVEDAVDTCTDADGDGYGDPGFPASQCAVDNCPAVPNPDQADLDGDLTGDPCDDCIDTDGDGYGNDGFAASVVGSEAGAQEMALGDVDGQNGLDLVVGRLGVNRLYLNNGTADPWNGVTGSEITSDAYETFSVALGDVDGDGDLDLVAGNTNSPNRLYRNNGTVAPWNGVTGSDITSDADVTLAVALGDVDGDGDLDLVAGNNNSPNRLYRNNGTSNPWNGVVGVDITADSSVTQSVALGDVDRDGDLDLVAGNSDAANRLYLNNGTSNPWTGVVGVDITADAHETSFVALGDVNGDGDLDLVAGNLNAPNRLYRNNGTTEPWDGVVGVDITADADWTFSIALGDLSGDGDLDLVAGNYDDVNRVYRNNGTINPWSDALGVDITTDAEATLSVVLGDVDGDADLDLVAGGVEGVRRYLTSWVNACQADNCPVQPNAGQADLDGDRLGDACDDCTDADGDGYGNPGFPNSACPDVDNCPFAPNPGQEDLDGDGIGDPCDDCTDVDGDGYGVPPLPWSSGAGTNISDEARYTMSVALGDVDGDDDIDLVAGSYLDGVNRLYVNNGSSDPWTGVSGVDITTDAHYTFSVALGDVDGDLDLDLVAGNIGVNRLYLNNGTLDPWGGATGRDITGDHHDTYSVALGDVDGDLDLDLVVGNAGETNRLYLNDGTPDPWNGVTGQDITTDAHATAWVALGDVNGDTHPDLVVGNYGEVNRVYLNNGTATPWNGVTGLDITADVHLTASLALGDVDGDLDLDLVVGNYGEVNRLYRNNGTLLDPWSGVTPVDITADANATYSVALGDVDADGDLDLVAGNDGEVNRLYLNNGTLDPWNGVSGVAITSDANATFVVVLGDVDGDDDLDLVAGNYGEVNRLYLNDTVAGCAADCDDANPNCSSDCLDADGDDFCVTSDCDEADPNNWISCGGCMDTDGDGWHAGCDAYVTIPGPDCDDGVEECTSDCTVPSEARQLGLTRAVGPGGLTTLSWDEPAQPGGLPLVYDTLSSAAAGDFLSGECIEIDGADTTSSDTHDPAPGEAIFYLVRAENPCRVGSLGAGSDLTPRAGRSCALDKTVFVSSTVSDGDLGGVAGADALCAGLATAAGLAGTYKAWISDDFSGPSTTFTPSAIPYALVGRAVIANNWADLTDGTLLVPIDQDENGASVVGPVWTGTLTNGDPEGVGNKCTSASGPWTQPFSPKGGDSGRTGDSSSTAASWTEGVTLGCGSTARIYCFEQ